MCVCVCVCVCGVYVFELTFALQVPHPAGMAASAVSESHPQVSPPLQVPRLPGQGE